MNRQARVPASTAVRMNSASNRIAKWYQKAIIALPPMADEMMWAMPTASVGAPPAREMIVCSPTSAAVWVITSGVVAKPSLVTAAAAVSGVVPTKRGGRVHGEVDARVDHAGRDQRHDRHEGFHQHAAVADEAGIGLAGDQLRRGARRDQGVEARDRAARDGDEQEREQAAGPDRTGAVDELGHRRHLHVRGHEGDAERQPDDGADLQEGRQVVARGEEQPDRQDRGDEAVADQHPAELRAREGEGRGPDRARRHRAAARRSPASAGRSRGSRPRRSCPGGCSANRRPSAWRSGSSTSP